MTVQRFVSERFLLLPLGATAAVVWANTAGESYFRTSHALAFAVNEVGMALFLGLLAHELIEAAMPGGVLHSWRRWTSAVVAAATGAGVAIGTYLAWVTWKHETVLGIAWPVAAAIDVAAGYYMLRLLRLGRGAQAFLLLVAVITSVAGLLVLGGWPARRGATIWGIAAIGAAVALAAFLRHRRVAAFWPYLVGCGTLSWAGCFAGGLHPALALLPIVPFMPRAPRRRDPFADVPNDDQVHRAENIWSHGMQAVVFAFGLVNAGVLVTAYDTGTWAVLVAALVGRPLGILLGAGLAVAIGLRLPLHVGWRELVVIALATSSGFTFALFAAASLLPIGAVLQQIKVGALSTVLGAIVTIVAARLLRVGRFRAA
jgi:NhaA family Na+:H+ antiporter